MVSMVYVQLNDLNLMTMNFKVLLEIVSKVCDNCEQNHFTRTTFYPSILSFPFLFCYIFLQIQLPYPSDFSFYQK